MTKAEIKFHEEDFAKRLAERPYKSWAAIARRELRRYRDVVKVIR